MRWKESNWWQVEWECASREDAHMRTVQQLLWEKIAKKELQQMPYPEMLTGQLETLVPINDDDDEFIAQGNFEKQHKSDPVFVEGREVRMSDIAMLVAEEYERRVSLVRKASVDGVVGISVSQERIEETQRLMKMKPKAESLSLKWVWEPKSLVGVAACQLLICLTLFYN